MMKREFIVVIGFVTMLSVVACMKPMARFEMSATHTEAPASISFVNQSTGADSYLWDFGDGMQSMDSNVQHQYPVSGQYVVSLTAKKANKSNTMTKPLTVDPPPKCLIEITTDYGVMVAELYDATPKHRDNFMKLAGEGYYDGLLFHRVIDGFMIQGGDPASKNAAPGVALGSGGPGYQVPAEFVDSLVHVKGAIAAARTGDAMNPEKKSSGSQFYIVHGSPVDKGTLDNVESRKGFKYTDEQRKEYYAIGGTPFLDRDYTVFGRIISGLEVIDAIAKVEKDQKDRPKKDVKMSMKVIR
ncbi:MAG TPA: peptidylprolyl isomerase [Saprospiraceae bacterium]|nr:peptidylprolyl isomerase [Saprospiraceae bacterium]